MTKSTRWQKNKPTHSRVIFHFIYFFHLYFRGFEHSFFKRNLIDFQFETQQKRRFLLRQLRNSNLSSEIEWVTRFVGNKKNFVKMNSLFVHEVRRVAV